MFFIKKYFKQLIILLAFLGISLIGRGQSINDHIRWKSNLRLEENKKVINVLPFVSLDPRGGFIITDLKESQIRLYDRDGHLKNHFGRKGRGPGELVRPTATCRLPNGDLVVGEFMGQLNRFTANGDSLKKSFMLPNYIINDLHAVGDHKVLLVGYKRSKKNTSLLFLYDLKKGSIEKNFFSIPKPLGTYAGLMYSIKTLSNADIYDDKIIANFGVATDFYIYNLDGQLKKKVNANFKNFRKIKKPEGNPSKKLLTTFSWIEKVEWNTEDIFLVRYLNFKNIKKRELEHTLALVNTDGHVLFEQKIKPVLLVANPNTNELFFRQSYDKPANKWKVGTLKE